jgi:PKD repeat protein
MRFHYLAIVSLFALFSTRSNAQTIDLVTLSPSPLMECQAITVTVDGWQPMPQFFIDSTVYNVSGSQVNITIHWNAPPFGNPMIAPYTETLTIPANTLGNGNYTFVVQNYFVLTNTITATSTVLANLGSCCTASADFAIAQPQVCEGDDVFVQDLCAGYDAIQWLLDGQVYSSVPGDFNLSGLATGQYNLQVVASSSTCADTLSSQFTVNALPPAQYTYSQLGNNFTFTASGLASNNYVWDFGDGTIDSGQIITHLYELGEYEPCLTVTNISGCSETYCDSVVYSNVGMAEWGAQDLYIYPNPASSRITISGGNGIPVLYDALGREVAIEPVGFSENSATFDVRDLPPGYYTVRVDGQIRPLIVQ